jgi:type IV secretory pathway TrbD component
MVTMFWIQYSYSKPATIVVWEIARAQAVRQIVLHPNLLAIASREFVLLNALLILTAMTVILSRLIAALITVPVGIFLFLIAVMASCK